MKKHRLLARRNTLALLPVVTIVPLLLGADAARSVDPAPSSRTPAPPPRAQPAASAQHEAADAFVGTFRFVGGQAQRDALDAAIDGVVSEMNVLVRGIARDRLRDSNPIPGRITLRRTGDTMAITFDQRTYEASLDGSATKVVGITGDTLEYRLQLLPQGVRQVFDGDGGGRTNNMKMREDGRLDLSVEVRSGRLPMSLRYRLAFRRE
jgi:hypothetical protein